MAELEESMSTGGHQSGKIEKPSVACEATATAHEQCEYATAVEGGMLRSCTKSGEERSDYVLWLKQLQSGCASEVEFNTARSMATWTQVAGTLSCFSEGMSLAEKEMIVSENRQFFQDLIKKQPPPLPSAYQSDDYSIDTYPHLRPKFFTILYTSPFFVDFKGRLEVGERIGAGGQAEIYEVLFDGEMSYQRSVCDDLEETSYVLKVFRLEHSELFRHEWAQKFNSISMKCIQERKDFSWYCGVRNCTILKDGRFAYVMRRYWKDLRDLIDRQILKDETHLRSLFPHPVSINIMYLIATDMQSLHGRGILHRDLKAANVLVTLDFQRYVYIDGYFTGFAVSDFDSTDGVMGTRFWRAPEVLRILRSEAKDKHSNPTVWTTKVDVYAYAMTCYEVLSGCIPFHNRPQDDYDIGDERPLLPDYVDEEIQELVGECWNSDPSKRPSFEIIVDRLTRYKERRNIPDPFYGALL